MSTATRIPSERSAGMHSHDPRAGGWRSAPASAHRPSRLSLILVLIVALLLTGAVRMAVHARHDVLQHRRISTNRAAGMDTFALGLILGGLRGPLVMFLWTSTENQKIEKDLENIDTKIELIRMLQPEFDSVHIFQSWNKAYNLSVQMAGLPNKYAVILSGLDYLEGVDQERPDNVNIIAQQGDLYFNKLGNSAEKWYYMDRIRRETLPREGARPAAAGWQRSEHEVMLQRSDAGFVSILPQYLAGRVNLGKGPDFYNGAELQFLERYNTPQAGGFPYGLTPIAIGFNHHERARSLWKILGRGHLQLSDAVIDSRPGVTLKHWSEEQWERARRFEGALLGKPIPRDDQQGDRFDYEQFTADLPPSAPFAAGPFRNSDILREARDQRQRSAPELVAETMFSYRRAVQTAAHAREQLARHIADFKLSVNSSNYLSMIDELRASEHLLLGDLSYLALIAQNAGVSPPSYPESANPRQQAEQNYRRAIMLYYRLLLKFTIDEEVAVATFPTFKGKKLDKATIAPEADPDREDPELHAIYPKVFQDTRDFIKRTNRGEGHAEVVREYILQLQRAQQRLARLTGN